MAARNRVLSHAQRVTVLSICGLSSCYKVTFTLLCAECYVMIQKCVCARNVRTAIVPGAERNRRTVERIFRGRYSEESVLRAIC